MRTAQHKSASIIILAVFFFMALVPTLFAASSGSGTSKAIGGTPATGIQKKTDLNSGPSIPPATMTLDKLKLPMLRVTSFKKYVDPTTVVSMGGSSSSAPTSTSIDLGEDIELYWAIAFENVQTPNVNINGTPVTGTRHTASDGTFWMAGRKTFRPGTTTNYLLSATAARESGAGAPVQTSQSYRVVVKKPVLTLLAPEVNQSTFTMKFFLKNTGNADFQSTPINVGYSVEGGSLANGTFATAPMAIARNQTVELGQVTLTDRSRAFRTDSIRISVRAGAYYRMPLTEATGNFTHTWRTSTFRINNATLNLLGMGTVCEIMIDNFNDSHGSGFAITPPFEPNASFVDFNVLGHGDRMTFSLPHMESVSSGGTLKYWTYLRNIRSFHRGDSDLFSVEGGKLKISLDFPNPDAREIKIGRIGNLGRLEDKWIDNDAPDVNLSSFTVNILVTPTLSSGQLSYSGVDVQISGLSASFAGGWSWLNAGFQDYITRVIRRNLDSALTSVLNSGSIKSAIVEGINNGISAAGATITRVVSVVGSGATITITYL